MKKGRIAIEGMKIFAHHGYYEEERLMGKEFIVDVYLEFDFEDVLVSDHIRDTINYEEVIDLCLEEMNQPSKVLEQVAIRMAERISRLSDKPLGIKIRIQKPYPVLKVPMDRFYVEYETHGGTEQGI